MQRGTAGKGIRGIKRLSTHIADLEFASTCCPLTPIKPLAGECQISQEQLSSLGVFRCLKGNWIKNVENAKHQKVHGAWGKDTVVNERGRREGLLARSLKEIAWPRSNPKDKIKLRANLFISVINLFENGNYEPQRQTYSMYIIQPNCYNDWTIMEAALQKTNSLQRIEMSRGRPWTDQVDWKHK